MKLPCAIKYYLVFKLYNYNSGHMDRLFKDKDICRESLIFFEASNNVKTKYGNKLNDRLYLYYLTLRQKKLM